MTGFPRFRFFSKQSPLANQPYKHGSSQNPSYDTPRRPLWRPSRWFHATPTPCQNPDRIPFLYRFQQKHLVDHRNFGGISKTPQESPQFTTGSWYGRRRLSKWTKSTLKWTPIPIVVGIFGLLYRQLVVSKRNDTDGRGSAGGPTEVSQYARRPLPWQVPTVFYMYQFLPLRAISRSWGWLNDLYLPHWLRRPVLRSYVWLFGCNLSEAAIQDLIWYKNLGAFFRRHLRPGVRPIDAASYVVSPSDGTVLHVGRVEDDCVEQVKGMTYSLSAFLGPKNWFSYTKDEEPVVEENEAPEPSPDYRSQLRSKPGTDLYHCVIYLAPGDYHRFHSPADWKISFRRHFPGHLFSVSPTVTRRVEGLFNYNERVVYYGTWEHGFFSMAAVGATNVGSIRVYFDERLKTNNKRYKRGAFQDWNFSQHMAPSPAKGVALAKGDDFGEFNLGSTIVLLFEAPKNFRFNVEVGEQLLYGKPLGYLDENVIIDEAPSCSTV